MASRSTFIFTIGYTVALLTFLTVLFVPAAGNLDWPSWVQAIGSVGAILVAIWISRREAVQAERLKRRERQEFRSAIAALARQLADWIIAEADSMIEGPEYHIFEGSNGFDAYLLKAALDKFDPALLVSAEGILALERLKLSLDSHRRWETVLREDHYMTADHDFDIPDAIRKWAKQADDYATTLEKLAQS